MPKSVINFTANVGRAILEAANLFRSAEKAIWEYIANGLQYKSAGVNSRIEVQLDNKLGTVTITDNGEGMDITGLRHFFMLHAPNLVRKAGKVGRGMWGTGKAAAFGIGKELCIVTVQNNFECKVSVDTASIKKAKTIVPLNVHYTGKPVSKPNGTVITIKGVHNKLDLKKIQQHIERELVAYPNTDEVKLNGRLCVYSEPANDGKVRTFRPNAKAAAILGDLVLNIKVAKTRLPELVNGIMILCNSTLMDTTLVGLGSKSMTEFIYGCVEAPGIDTNPYKPQAFDSSRSGLNVANSYVATLFGFIGASIETVRQELVEKDRELRATDENRRLQSSVTTLSSKLGAHLRNQEVTIAGRIINQPGEVSSKSGDMLTPGTEIPAIPSNITSTSQGGTGGGGSRGTGGSSTSSSSATDTHESVIPSEGAEKCGKPIGGKGSKSSKQGLDIVFRALGTDQTQAQFDIEQRCLIINTENPTYTKAMAAGDKSAVFLNFLHNIAIEEYATGITYIKTYRGLFASPGDSLTERRRISSELHTELVGQFQV